MTERETLKKWLDESSNIVFFGGAGVSTESHIPDFRSTDGLYNQQYDYPPETIISHSFYRRNPEEFYRFIRIKCCFRMRNPMRRIWHWRSWSSRARFARLSLRTLTGCIRQQEAGKCWSCMALSTGITVPLWKIL